MSRNYSKPGITSRDFKTRPSLAGQRKAMQEMSTASFAGGAFRKSIDTLLARAKDNKTHLRFTSILFKILQADTLNPKGNRRIENGNLNLLHGIEFNNHASLQNVLSANYEASINRVEGQLSFSVKSFIPNQNINAPAGASHYRIVMAGIEADFFINHMNSQVIESGFLPLDDLATGDLLFTSTLSPDSSLPLFLVAGIQFYNQLNGAFYPLMDKKYHPLKIMKVDIV
jgi:hypothetical protein